MGFSFKGRHPWFLVSNPITNPTSQSSCPHPNDQTSNPTADPTSHTLFGPLLAQNTPPPTRPPVATNPTSNPTYPGWELVFPRWHPWRLRRRRSHLDRLDRKLLVRLSFGSKIRGKRDGTGGGHRLLNFLHQVCMWIHRVDLRLGCDK